MNSGVTVSHRTASIDILKGLVIVSVICLHTVSRHTLSEIAALFHIWQAVPVFIFLMARNAAMSLTRRGGRSLRELYSRDYLASRFDRVYVPFLLAFAATVVLTVALHRAHYGIRTIGGGLVVGTLPINGPGNYFITLVFQFALVFPLVLWGLRARPVATLLACLAVDLGFEAIAPRLGVIRNHPFIYEVCLARYLLLVALGAMLASVPVIRLLRSRLLWAGALLSTAYLVLAQVDIASIPIGESDWRGQAFASVFYTALLVALGIQLLPDRARGWLARGLAELGRASYHVFLVQIIWFGLIVWSSSSVAALSGNLLITLSVGVAFYRLMERVPLPSAAAVLARRTQARLAA